MDQNVPQDSDTPAFRRIKNPETLAASLREGDGVDPRLEHRKSQQSRGKNKPNHAALRLASQIARCIRGSLGVGLLVNFDVVGVEPAKGNHFLVTIGPVADDFDYDEAVILDAVNDLRGQLRSEIAGSIHRKKVPSLTFRVLPCPAH